MSHKALWCVAGAAIPAFSAVAAEPILDLVAARPGATTTRGVLYIHEDFESGFVPGPVLGQKGWGVMTFGTEPASNAVIFASGVQDFGDFSLRVRADVDPTGAIRAFSPGAGIPHTQLAADCNFNAPQFSTPTLEFIDTPSGLIVTRIAIINNGIEVLQADPFNPVLGVLVPTTGIVNATQITRLGIRLTNNLRTLEVFQDGDLIFTGNNIAAKLFDDGVAGAEPVGITDFGVSIFPILSLPDIPNDEITADNIGSWLTCPTDLNGDGVTDTADLGLLIGAFGEGPDEFADINGDGAVDTADLGLLLSVFGQGCGV